MWAKIVEKDLTQAEVLAEESLRAKWEANPITEICNTEVFLKYVLLRKKIKRRCREMKMGAQTRTGKRLPDTGKRFRDRICAYETFIQLLFLFVFSISNYFCFPERFRTPSSISRFQ